MTTVFPWAVAFKARVCSMVDARENCNTSFLHHHPTTLQGSGWHGWHLLLTPFEVDGTPCEAGTVASLNEYLRSFEAREGLEFKALPRPTLWGLSKIPRWVPDLFSPLESFYPILESLFLPHPHPNPRVPGHLGLVCSAVRVGQGTLLFREQAVCKGLKLSWEGGLNGPLELLTLVSP